MNDRKVQTCTKHGEVVHVLEKRSGYYRCQRCRNDHVIEYRRNRKKLLIKEHGGKCKICGYSKYFGALQFHHLDPKQKEFGLAQNGKTLSLKRLRAEAIKCELLCANCHAEVEGGIVILANKSV